MERDLHDENRILQQTFAKLISKVHQDGFREGVEEGKTRSFQNGFDQGYASGFQAGFTQACFSGSLRTLNAVKPPPTTSALEELPAPNKAMCQMCLPSTQQPASAADVKAWQASVTGNTELKKKYQILNEMVGTDIVKVDV